MHRFAAGIDQRGDRQLHVFDNLTLGTDLAAIRFDQCKTVIGHVVIFDTLTIQRIEPNPAAGFLIPVAEHLSDIAAAVFQAFHQFPCRSVIGAPARDKAAVCFIGIGHIADLVFRVKERVQVTDQLVSR